MCRAKKKPKNTADGFLACFRSQLQRSLLVLPPLPHILSITQAIFSFDATNLIFFPTCSVLSPRTRWGLNEVSPQISSQLGLSLFLVKLAFGIKPRMGSAILTTGSTGVTTQAGFLTHRVDNHWDYLVGEPGWNLVPAGRHGSPKWKRITSTYTNFIPTKSSLDSRSRCCPSSPSQNNLWVMSVCHQPPGQKHGL